MGGTEKSRGETKILKRGRGKTGSRGGCLKRVGRCWNPLMNYALNFHTVFQVSKVLKNLLDSLQLHFRHKF